MSTPTPTIDAEIAQGQRDLDLDAMLDAAVPPPTCEYILDKFGATCGDPATWIMTLSCGHSAYFDDLHVVPIRATVEEVDVTLCAATGTPRHPANLAVSASFDRIAS